MCPMTPDDHDHDHPPPHFNPSLTLALQSWPNTNLIPRKSPVPLVLPCDLSLTLESVHLRPSLLPVRVTAVTRPSYIA